MITSLKSSCEGVTLTDTNWWRTTPVSTKAWYHGGGGADTHTCPAPTTSEDEGCGVLLHRLRTSSHPTPFTRVDLSFFPRIEIDRPARVLAGPLLRTFVYYDYIWFRVVGLKWALPLSTHLGLCKRGRDPPHKP